MRALLSLASRPGSRQWICSSCRLKSARSYCQPSEPSQRSQPLIKPNTPEKLRAQGPFRTRFAPSPTGYLHLGSLRTALFNYLIAKATGGQFILRIEDTDQKRTVPDAEQRLFEDLQWAGIEWDEGPKVGGPYGPYKQSQRLSIYTVYAQKLIDSGHAYRCFCTPERLNSLAHLRTLDNQQIGYDRACYRRYSHGRGDMLAAEGLPHVVRLKAPQKYPLIKDLVYGHSMMRTSSRFYPEDGDHASFEDPILIKSDGFPTYHLANVVDDHLMNITHVIRGAEWMSSLPKHLALYEAFGWQPPQFAHVGLLLDSSRAKLSKRNQDIDIASYRRQGIFPETLTNFVALLGWSHTKKHDAMSMQDLIENASMKYTRGDSVVSFEKLWFLQKAHAARYASLPPTLNASHSLSDLAVYPICELLSKGSQEDFEIFHLLPSKDEQKKYVTKLLLVDAAKYTTASDFINRNRYFFRAPTEPEIGEVLTPLELSIRSSKKGAQPLARLPVPTLDSLDFLTLLSQLTHIPATSWNSTELKDTINSIGLQASLTITLPNSSSIDDQAVPDLGIQRAWGTLVHEFIRWALLARYNGPDTAVTMAILGRAESIRRLNRAGQMMRSWVEENENAKEVHEIGDV